MQGITEKNIRYGLTFKGKHKPEKEINKNDKKTGKAVINLGGKIPVRATRPSNNQVRKKQANKPLDKRQLKIR